MIEIVMGSLGVVVGLTCAALARSTGQDPKGWLASALWALAFTLRELTR